MKKLIFTLIAITSINAQADLKCTLSPEQLDIANTCLESPQSCPEKPSEKAEKIFIELGVLFSGTESSRGIIERLANSLDKNQVISSAYEQVLKISTEKSGWNDAILEENSKICELIDKALSI